MSGADLHRTDRFRHNGRSALLLASLCAALLGLLLAGVFLGDGYDPGSYDPLWAALGSLFLGALVAAALWVAWNRPVMLVVGPDGLNMPVGWRGPVAWRDIHRIRRHRARRQLFEVTQSLEVDLSPGVLPDYRFAGPRRLELWLRRKWALRIPIHQLDPGPDAVIASIERFRPVTRVQG